jgi:hemolysin activation/secretion protein
MAARFAVPADRPKQGAATREGPVKRCPGPRRARSAAAWSACAALCAWQLPQALAQSVSLSQVLPSQVLPATLRPTPNAATAAMPVDAGPGPAETVPPAGEDGVAGRVVLAQVAVEGGFPALSEAARSLDERLRGAPVSMREIQFAAVQLEHSYAAAGYPLARIVVPPQRLVDGGRLVLRVIDGFIEEIVVDGVDAPMRALVRERLQPLVGVHRLTSATLERMVLLAGELPGLRLRSVLVAGTQDGGTRLVVDGHFSPQAGQVRVDNALSSAMGRWEIGATLALNSPLGRGEQWYAALAEAPSQDASRPALRSLGLGLVMPTGTPGATVNLEYLHAQTAPQASADALTTEGDYERWSLRATQAILREHDQRIDAHVAIEGISQALVASDFAVDLNRDNYRALRLGVAGEFILSQAASLHLGLFADAGLGGRDDGDAATSGVPISRAGASPRFTKAGIELDFYGSGTGGWEFELHSRGQASGRALLVPEAFAMANPDTLSAFDTGSLNTDNGLLARLQLGRRLTPLVSGPTSWLAYGFAAAAHGHVFDATAVQAPTLDAVAAGVGLRTTREWGNGRSLAIGIEAALGHASTSSPTHASRVGISLDAHL